MADGRSEANDSIDDGSSHALEVAPEDATTSDKPSLKVAVIVNTSVVPTSPPRVLEVPTSFATVNAVTARAVSTTVTTNEAVSPPKAPVMVVTPAFNGTSPR
jgi:hypothetical protein